MLADIRPNEEHAKEHIERNPVTTVVQVVPEMSEHEVSSACTLNVFNHVTYVYNSYLTICLAVCPCLSVQNLMSLDCAPIIYDTNDI